MAANVTPLSSGRTPACWRHRFSPARADEGPPDFGRPRSGSVRVLGYRYSDGALAVPAGDVVRRAHLLSVSTRIGVEAPHTPFAPRQGAGGEPTPLPLGSPDGVWRIAPLPSGTSRPGRLLAESLHGPPVAPKPPGASGLGLRSRASAGGHSRAQSALDTTDSAGCRVASVTSPRPTRP